MRNIIKLFPVFAGICWGGSGIFVRVLYGEGLDNMTIIFSRLLVTVGIMAIWIFCTDRSLFKVSKKDMPLLVLSGILGYFMMNTCYNVAIHTLSLSLAAVLLCTAPVYVIIFGAIVFKEKITPLKIICMAAVFFGCVLLSGVVETGALQWSVMGIAFGIACSICNAVCTMGCNEASGVRGLHPATVLFYNSLFAMIPTIPFVKPVAITGMIADGPAFAIFILVMNALMSSLLPNLFFNISFKYMESGIVSILASGAEPTAALIFGIVLYHEVPTFVGFIGMVVVITSIIILTASKQKQKIPAQNPQKIPREE